MPGFLLPQLPPPLESPPQAPASIWTPRMRTVSPMEPLLGRLKLWGWSDMVLWIPTQVPQRIVTPVGDMLCSGQGWPGLHKGPPDYRQGHRGKVRNPGGPRSAWGSPTWCSSPRFGRRVSHAWFVSWSGRESRNNGSLQTPQTVSPTGWSGLDMAEAHGYKRLPQWLKPWPRDQERLGAWRWRISRWSKDEEKQLRETKKLKRVQQLKITAKFCTKIKAVTSKRYLQPINLSLF